MYTVYLTPVFYNDGGFLPGTGNGALDFGGVIIKKIPDRLGNLAYQKIAYSFGYVI